MHNNGNEGEGRVRRLDRRTLLKTGAGLSIATVCAATGTAGGFLYGRDRYVHDTQNINFRLIELPFPLFDINSVINESDWEETYAEVEEYRKQAYQRFTEKGRGDLSVVQFKEMITEINQQKADKIPMNDLDWEIAIARLGEFATDDDLLGYTYFAAAIQTSFPQRSDQLHGIIDKNSNTIINWFKKINDIYLHVIPSMGLALTKLYADRDISIDEQRWEKFTNMINTSYNNGNYRSVGDLLAPLKHYAPERLPDSYFDQKLHNEVINNSITELQIFRSAGNYWEFTKSALTPALLEKPIT